MTDITITEATPADAGAWERLRDALWADGEGAHAAEIAAALAAPDAGRLILLAFADGDAIGLAEAAIRHDYVNGCATSPVVFAEGLYVVDRWRRRGVARALVQRIFAWARKTGCLEVASDALIENHGGHALHAALGFEATERVVFFRKALT